MTLRLSSTYCPRWLSWLQCSGSSMRWRWGLLYQLRCLLCWLPWLAGHWLHWLNCRLPLLPLGGLRLSVLICSTSGRVDLLWGTRARILVRSTSSNSVAWASCSFCCFWKPSKLWSLASGSWACLEGAVTWSVSCLGSGFASDRSRQGYCSWLHSIWVFESQNLLPFWIKDRAWAEAWRAESSNVHW